MTKQVKKSVLGSVRLDSDVWEAVRGMECSLNAYLRGRLLSGVEVRGDKSPVAEMRQVKESLGTQSDSKVEVRLRSFKERILKPSENGKGK